MTQDRSKYGALPDLDSAPDIYETKLDTHSPRSSRSSSRSSYQETPQSPTSSTGGIDRGGLQPAQARSQFAPATVDARQADFSDNVVDRKSYKVGSRRRRRRRKQRIEYEAVGGMPDGEDEAETFEERIARLQREVEEVQAEQAKVSASEKEDIITRLSSTLSTLETTTHSSLPQPQTASESTSTALTLPDVPDSTQTAHALTLASSLDTRLASLESTLGLPTLTATSKPLTTQLQSLSGQLATLSNTTPAILSSAKSQLDALTASADALTAARKRAIDAKTDLRSSANTGTRPLSGSAGSFSTTRPSSYHHRQAQDETDRLNDETAATLLAGEETETAARVHALHTQLPTFETLAPLVPSLLERLRSLHTLHTFAADAADNLELLEKRQAEMGGELSKWRETLDHLEGRLSSGDEMGRGNKAEVEKWVKELESKFSNA